jgi:hypothetical protein
MAGLSLSWTVPGPGSSRCTIDDGKTHATVPASYLSDAPNDLIHTVTRVIEGSKLSRIQFAGEPGAYRWSFHRYGDFVDIEILSVTHERMSDSDGRPVWSTDRQPVADLARACVDCFTSLKDTLGEDTYERSWGFPFPATSLVLLTNALGRQDSADTANTR